MGKVKQKYHEDIEAGLFQGKRKKQVEDSAKFAILGIVIIILMVFALFVFGWLSRVG